MTQVSRFLPAAALLAALGAAGVATADGGQMRGFGHGGPGGSAEFGSGGPRSIDFAAIDANADGSLGRTELLDRSAAKLAVLDLNGDGALDRAELITAFPAANPVLDVFSASPAEAMADRMIAMNGGTAEGRVDMATLSEAQVNRLLTRLDADHDDAISAAEAEAPMGRHAGHDGEGRRRGSRF